MISELLSEEEFKKRLAYWVLDNDRGSFIPIGYNREDYAELYRMPDFDYVHTQSYTDENGDAVSPLYIWQDGRGDLPYDESCSYAARLSEETGYSADEYISLGCCCTSPGITDEVLHLYLALGLHKGDSHPDEDEFLNVERIPLRELSRMAMANEIEDAKTVIAVLKAEKYLSERGIAF